tara:strand:+ start:11656 stop:11883 length:228 start_codon:yes stop_codon:yes gene_type:complete
MTQTEALEIFALYLTKLGLTVEIIELHFNGFKWSQLITIPALVLGWTNALSVRAISETLGYNITNEAIFGNNTCF